MSKNKISIIVPIYNVERYIDACFDSIASQTYKGEIECIFVDDCGQDNSVCILENRIADYHGPIAFSLFHHVSNKGLSAARNTGIHHATGDYLYFLDSDDTITPDCIEKLESLAEKYEKVDLVQGGVLWINIGSSLKNIDVPEFSSEKKWIKKAFLQLKLGTVTSWNKLVNRRFILDHQLYFEEGVVHEDVPWYFFLSKYTRSIAFCKSDTYIYNINPSGISKSIADERKALAPVIKLVCENVGGSFAVDEIFFITRILKMNKIHDLQFLESLNYPTHVLRTLFSLQDHLFDTSKFSVKGLALRISYHALIWIVNHTYREK